MEIANDKKILNSVVQKAWEDSVFKRNLIQNPVATLEGFLGESVKAPDGKKIAVVDQTDDSTFFINIPAKPVLDMELDDDQLDTISGGVDPRFGI